MVLLMSLLSGGTSRLRVDRRRSVDVCRRLNRGVLDPLLLPLHRRAGLIQPETAGLAEHMPPKFRHEPMSSATL